MKRVRKEGRVYFIRKPSSIEYVTNKTEEFNKNQMGKQKYKIIDVITVKDKNEFNLLINNLLIDNKYIINCQSKNKTGVVDGVVHCIQVVCVTPDGSYSNEGILINNEGYDYARYVALPEINKEVSLTKGKALKLNDFELVSMLTIDEIKDILFYFGGLDEFIKMYIERTDLLYEEYSDDEEVSTPIEYFNEYIELLEQNKVELV